MKCLQILEILCNVVKSKWFCKMLPDHQNLWNSDESVKSNKIIQNFSKSNKILKNISNLWKPNRIIEKLKKCYQIIKIPPHKKKQFEIILNFIKSLKAITIIANLQN